MSQSTCELCKDTIKQKELRIVNGTSQCHVWCFQTHIVPGILITLEIQKKELACSLGLNSKIITVPGAIIA